MPAVGGYAGGYEANLRLEAKEVLTQPCNNYIHATAESSVWLCLWLALVAGSGGGRSGGSEAATVEVVAAVAAAAKGCRLMRAHAHT